MSELHYSQHTPPLLCWAATKIFGNDAKSATFCIITRFFDVVVPTGQNLTHAASTNAYNKKQRTTLGQSFIGGELNFTAEFVYLQCVGC